MASYVPTKSSTRPYIPTSRRVRARSSASYSSSSSLSSDDASTSSPTSPASSGPPTPSTSILRSTSATISTAAVRQYTKKDLPAGHPLGDSATSKEAFMKEKRYFPLLEEVEDDHWKNKPWTHPLYLGEQFDSREIRGTCGKKASRSKSHNEDMARLTVNELVVTRPDIGACFREDLKRPGLAALHVKAIGDRGQAILGNCWTSKIDKHGDRCIHDNGEVENRAAGLAYRPPLVKKTNAKGDSKLGEYQPWTLANEKVIKPYVPGRDIDAGIAKWQLDNPPKIVSTPSAATPPAKDKGKGKRKAQSSTSESVPSQCSAANLTHTSLRKNRRQTGKATTSNSLPARANPPSAISQPGPQSSLRASSLSSDDEVKIVKRRKVNDVSRVRRTEGSQGSGEQDSEKGAGMDKAKGHGKQAKRGQVTRVDNGEGSDSVDKVFRFKYPLRLQFSNDVIDTTPSDDVAELYQRWQAKEYSVTDELIHASAGLVASSLRETESLRRCDHGKYNLAFDEFTKEVRRLEAETKRREEEISEREKGFEDREASLKTREREAERNEELESLREERSENIIKEKEKMKRDLEKALERAIKAEKNAAGLETARSEDIKENEKMKRDFERVLERAVKAEKKAVGLETKAGKLSAMLKAAVDLAIPVGAGAEE